MNKRITLIALLMVLTIIAIACSPAPVPAPPAPVPQAPVQPPAPQPLAPQPAVQPPTAAAAQYNGTQPRTPIEKIPEGGEMRNFKLVAYNPLLDSKLNLPRGNNGGLAVIRDCVYVGSNIANQPTIIVDMKDITKPTVIGDVPGINGRSMGTESFQGVADLNILVNTARTGSVGKAIVDPADKNIGMIVLDVTDCRKPVLVAKIDVFNEATHYMNLWRDPKKPERTLASMSYSSGPDGVDIRVWDLTGCPKTCNPKLVAEWGLEAQLGIKRLVTTKYEGGQREDNTGTHDHTYSLDGTRIHLAQSRYGYFQLDSSALAEGRTCNSKPATSPTATGYCISVLPDFKPLPAGTEAATVHGIVSIPGRPYVIMNHEGTSCPFGGITIAYIGNKDGIYTTDKLTGKVTSAGNTNGAYRGDLFPRHVGSFAIPEQNMDRCPKLGDVPPKFSGPTGVYGMDVLRGSKTVHDTIAFPNIAFSTWDGGGLRAIDITNPYTPFELGYFFNKPAPEVRWCSGRSGPCAEPEIDAEGIAIRQKGLLPPDIEARSYPVTMDGYIVYSDQPSGLYVLKYTGLHAEEIPQKGTCVAQNPSTVNVGFEPCAPYKTWSPSDK